MNETQFKIELSNIKTAKSVTGKIYTLTDITNENINFRRNDNVKFEKISIDELYNLYNNENNYNTSIAKSYISGRVQSPAVAILNEIKKKQL